MLVQLFTTCVVVKLASPLALRSGRSAPVLPQKHVEQIANPPLLYLLYEGMTER